MHSGATNPRGSGARSLAEGVGEGQPRATNRHRGGGRERRVGEEGARADCAGRRGLVREAASDRGGAGREPLARRKTLFTRKSGLRPFWQAWPNASLMVAVSVGGKAGPGGRKQDRRLQSANGPACARRPEGT